ncbi:rod shape-determining protein RodA [candidate division WOR-3 bacterium]|nr:rod shape-determining protein RodA [candidate division WOR-3 bacterium]
MDYKPKEKNAPDAALIAVTALILLFGLFALNQATLWAGSSFLLKQIIWIAVSIIVMFLISLNLKMSIVISYSYVIYALTVVFLFFPLLPFLGAGQANRWVDFRIFKAQPSDIAKLGLIFSLARYLSERYTFYDAVKRSFLKWRYSKKDKFYKLPAAVRRKPNDPLIIIESFVLTLIPFSIVMAEPDLGTSIVYIFIFLTMLYFSGVSLATVIYIISPFVSVLLAILLVVNSFSVTNIVFITLLFSTLIATFVIFRVKWKGVVAVMALNILVMVSAPLIWNGVLKEYQRKRVLIFLDSDSDPTGAGWHILQSKMAIGSGRIWGEGILHLEKRELSFLPEQHTDFIFPVIAKKSGFIGSVFLMTMYLLFLMRSITLAYKTKSMSYHLVIIGICSLFAFQITVNIGMTLGSLPIVGIPLPFISYGGSSMLMSFFLLGILFNLSSTSQ